MRPALANRLHLRHGLRRPAPVYPPLPAFYGPITTEPWPIPGLPDGIIAPRLWRQEVINPFPERARGTIVIDPDAALLHFVQGPDTAMRYGVSVGRRVLRGRARRACNSAGNGHDGKCPRR